MIDNDDFGRADVDMSIVITMIMIMIVAAQIAVLPVLLLGIIIIGGMKPLPAAIIAVMMVVMPVLPAERCRARCPGCSRTDD
jgi:hypothetical protein